MPLPHLLRQQHEGESILIVTHTVTLKIIMSHFFKERQLALWQPPYIHPTALCKVVIEDQQVSIELHGDISHYPEEMDGYKA